MIPITYLIGDATRPVGSGLKIVAHCCNDEGAWGAGFVLALSARWKKPERDYRAQRAFGGWRLGDVQFVAVKDDIVVANIIGQHGTGWLGGIPPIRYDAIREGFNRIEASNVESEAFSVHMPRLGCGLAGGDWKQIERLIVETLCARDVPVFVYDLPREAVAA